MAGLAAAATVTPLFSADEIAARVEALAREVAAYSSRDVVIVAILKGSFIFAADLIRALRERWIAGACLDAFVQEPLPADSPLWDLDNLILTPHSSYRSPLGMTRGLEEFAANLRRYLKGERLANPLKDPVLGY